MQPWWAWENKYNITTYINLPWVCLFIYTLLKIRPYYESMAKAKCLNCMICNIPKWSSSEFVSKFVNQFRPTVSFLLLKNEVPNAYHQNVRAMFADFILSLELLHKSVSQSSFYFDIFCITLITFCNFFFVHPYSGWVFERSVSNLLFFFSSCVLIRALIRLCSLRLHWMDGDTFWHTSAFKNGPGEVQPRGAHQLCPPGKTSFDIHWFKAVLFTMK